MAAILVFSSLLLHILSSTHLFVQAQEPAQGVTYLSLSEDYEVAMIVPALKRFREQTNISASFYVVPRSTTDFLEVVKNKYLEKHSKEVDLFAIDVVWAGQLKDHLADFYQIVGPSVADPFIPEAVADTVVDGRLVSLPWFTDYGLLYYRKDLLAKYGFSSPPTTWSELEAQAVVIQQGERSAGNGGFWGYVWQGFNYEGLTCDAMELIASHGGGTVVDHAGTVTIDNPATLKALKRAASWVGWISPINVVNYQEQETEEAFLGTSDGFKVPNAAFMRNWPYCIVTGNGLPAIRGKFGVAPLPYDPEYGGSSRGVLGGWNLAVSRYSDRPALAAKLATFLTSPSEQKFRYDAGGAIPTLKYWQNSSELCNRTAPEQVTICDLFANMPPGYPLARFATVTGDKYAAMTSVLFNYVHAVLTATADAETALHDMACKLEAIMQGAMPKRCMTEKSLTRAASVLCISVAGVCIAVTLVIAAFTLKHIEHPVIRASSPNFCFCIMLGAVVCLCSVPVDALSVSPVACWASFGTLAIGFGIMFGALFSKYQRIAAIFIMETLQEVKVTGQVVALRIVGVVLAECVGFAVWALTQALSDESMEETHVISEADNTYYMRCRHDLPGLLTLLVVNGVVVLWGAFLAWRTWRVAYLQFNESRQIGITIGMIAFCSFTMCPVLIFTRHDPTASFLLRSLSIIFVTMCAVLVIFGPKIHNILTMTPEQVRKWAEFHATGEGPNMLTSCVQPRKSGVTQGQGLDIAALATASQKNLNQNQAFPPRSSECARSQRPSYDSTASGKRSVVGVAAGASVVIDAQVVCAHSLNSNSNSSQRASLEVDRMKMLEQEVKALEQEMTSVKGQLKQEHDDVVMLRDRLKQTEKQLQDMRETVSRMKQQNEEGGGKGGGGGRGGGGGEQEKTNSMVASPRGVDVNSERPLLATSP